MSEALNLLELQSLIQEGIASAIPGEVRVKGELASVMDARNGHCYLELVQSEDGRQVAKIKAIIWASKAAFIKAYFKERTGSDLAAGMQVLLEAAVNYSALYGVSLYISGIEPEYSLGAAEKERQETIARLTKEGLLDKQKGLTLSRIPRRLAVISTPTGAGYGDFCRHLQENEYGYSFDIQLFEAVMQGVDAPASIIDAITRAEVEGEDAILILRGGGSSLDLAFADDYDLAFTIANCSVPVFTAIGHDRDFHVADMVSYHYVKTPTALADIFINAFLSEDMLLTSLRDRVSAAFEAKIYILENKLNLLENRVKYAVQANFQKREHALDLLESRIAAANPNKILAKGYALISGPKGALIHSVGELKKGESIGIRFADGSIKAEIKEVRPQKF